MGYEEEIPPLPTRNDEIAMMKRYADDFLAQPSYKFYQNDSSRKTKLDITGQLNTVKAHYWLNFCIGMLISAPAVYFTGSLFQRTASGVPYYYRPKYFFTMQKYYNQAKSIKTILIQIPLWLVLGFWYANRYTDTSFVDDEHLENYKNYKML